MSVWLEDLRHAVRQREREIGIRMALGASPGAMRRFVLLQGLRVVAAGAALGTAVSLVSLRLLRAMLFGVTPSDSLTYAVVLGVLFATAAAALYIPARWASSLDPARTLQGE